MKSVPRLAEPAALAAFRTARPDAGWEALRTDALDGGQQAYAEVRDTLDRCQRSLCAYCETRLRGPTEAENRGRQRVEHFHPKDDVSGPVNWALHWPNLWLVCQGGSQKPPAGEPIDPGNYLPPLPDNLSCDAFKDHQIRQGKLPHAPEGWILAPSDVPPAPRLFAFAPDGTPEPDAASCSQHLVPGNRHSDTATLVIATIRHLNLGCGRLNRLRCIVKAQLEKEIARARRANPGADRNGVLLRIARKLLTNDPGHPWHPFFTLVRYRLGGAAEQRLREMAYIA